MSPPQIIGILNVTPDSYHDGGWYAGVDAALARAEELLVQGVDILEVGGESTGPKSPEVAETEELDRTIPVIKEIIMRWPKTKISIDTWKSEVARRAIIEGACMVNDVTAGRSDSKLFPVIAESSVRLVLMFSKDPTPRTTVARTQYEDVVASVSAFLRERRDAAIAAGIPRERIILDPGMGHFVSSDPQYSFQLLARLRELESLGCPLFVSPSRKSFLAGAENLQTADRLPGTIAASAIAVLNGASYIRTHDVLEVRRACETAAAIRDARPR